MDPDIERIDVVVGLRKAGSSDYLINSDVDPPVDGEITSSLAPRIETTMRVLEGEYSNTLILKNDAEIEFDLSRVACEKAPTVFTYFSNDLVINTQSPATQIDTSTLDELTIERGKLEYKVPAVAYSEIKDEFKPASSDTPFECVICGHRLDIESPYETLDRWCDGECDELRTFQRQ